MVKQRKDAARGATYGARVALVTDTFQVPPFIQKIEQKKEKGFKQSLYLAWLLHRKKTQNQ